MLTGPRNSMLSSRPSASIFNFFFDFLIFLFFLHFSFILINSFTFFVTKVRTCTWPILRRGTPVTESRWINTKYLDFEIAIVIGLEDVLP